MECPRCHAENRPDARFCGHCGEALTPPDGTVGAGLATCPLCGRPVKSGAKFCGHCGAPMSPELPGGLRDQPSPIVGPGAGSPAPTVVQPSRVAPTPVVERADEAQAAVSAPLPMGDQHSSQPESRFPPAALAPKVGGASSRSRRPAWVLMVVVALASGAFFACLVVGLAVAPAFGRTVSSLPPRSPDRPDITISVEEAYLSDMVGQAMPDIIDGEAVLDVRPGNLVVVTVDFQLLIVRLQVVVYSSVSVEQGRIRVAVESIETGDSSDGHDLLDLLGKDELVLGDDITQLIQGTLEEELGEGAQLLTIGTDETRVILTARWE